MLSLVDWNGPLSVPTERRQMDPPLIECLENSLVGLVIQISMAAEINKLRAEISFLKHQPKYVGSQRQDEEDVSWMSDQMGHLCSFEQKAWRLGWSNLGDHLYAMGGVNGLLYFDNMECYDPVCGTWTFSKSMLEQVACSGCWVPAPVLYLSHRLWVCEWSVCLEVHGPYMSCKLQCTFCDYWSTEEWYLYVVEAYFGRTLYFTLFPFQPCICVLWMHSSLVVVDLIDNLMQLCVRRCSLLL